MEHVFCFRVIRTLDSEGFSLSFKKEMYFYHPTSIAGRETVLISIVTNSGFSGFLFGWLCKGYGGTSKRDKQILGV